MKYYCMCNAKNNGKLDDQAFLAPNRFGPYDNETQNRVVALKTPMKAIKNGIKQVLLRGVNIENDWSGKTLDELGHIERHYPNVDMHQCPNCGAIIIVE